MMLSGKPFIAFETRISLLSVSLCGNPAFVKVPLRLSCLYSEPYSMGYARCHKQMHVIQSKDGPAEPISIIIVPALRTSIYNVLYKTTISHHLRI